MNHKGQFQKYFDEINTIIEFTEAEKNGFAANYITSIPEMPGATFFHECARRCLVDLIKFIYENRKIDINYLDDDNCTPLGYIVNDETYESLKVSNELGTVNLGCEKAEEILKTIEYLVSIGCSAAYCDKEFSKEFVNKHVNLIKSRFLGH